MNEKVNFVIHFCGRRGRFDQILIRIFIKRFMSNLSFLCFFPHPYTLLNQGAVTYGVRTSYCSLCTAAIHESGVQRHVVKANIYFRGLLLYVYVCGHKIFNEWGSDDFLHYISLYKCKEKKAAKNK